jgi:hypothetical protein
MSKPCLQKILPFPATREEWKEETKKKLRIGKEVLSYLGIGYIPCIQNTVLLEINNY